MSISILLVDDDLDDAELFCDALVAADPDFKCHAARNGREALDLLDKILIPSLIFLDLNMPVMNGWDCLKLLKSNALYKNIPVLMYSTSSNQNEKAIAADLGALGFITKPDDYGELKRILKVLTLQIKNGAVPNLI